MSFDSQIGNIGLSHGPKLDHNLYQQHHQFKKVSNLQGVGS